MHGYFTINDIFRKCSDDMKKVHNLQFLTLCAVENTYIH